MADDSPMDKRRRQNKDSQRRFRERNNRTWRFQNVFLPSQAEHTITSSTSLLPSSSSTSSENITSYLCHHDPTLLSPESLPPANNDDGLYCQSQQYNGSNSVLQMTLPPFPTPFPRGDVSLPSTNGYPSLHQPQDFKSAAQAVRRTSKDGVVPSPPTPIKDGDLQMNVEPSKPTRHKEMPQLQIPTSRAEQMISDVEDLYEFGISLSLFPEDPLLGESLGKMKERFRSLVKIVGPHAHRSSVDDMSADSCQDSYSSD